MPKIIKLTKKYDGDKNIEFSIKSYQKCKHIFKDLFNQLNL